MQQRANCGNAPEPAFWALMAAKSQQAQKPPASVELATGREPLDWNDVRVLLALHRKRSLRGAAELLRVNASTVGRRLEVLEAALATRLFDRTKDGPHADRSG